MEKKSVSKKIEKGFIWYGVRASFYIMLGLWLLFTILEIVQPANSDQGIILSILSLVWVVSTVFNFVTAIIHLTKYNKKAFAIVSLVISSILLLLFLIGIGISLAA